MFQVLNNDSSVIEVWDIVTVSVDDVYELTPEMLKEYPDFEIVQG